MSLGGVLLLLLVIPSYGFLPPGCTSSLIDWRPHRLQLQLFSSAPPVWGETVSIPVTVPAVDFLQPLDRRVSAVYKVSSITGANQFVSISRDLKKSIVTHLTTQDIDDVDMVTYVAFPRPVRAEMNALVDSWLASESTIPVGNKDDSNTWSQPPMSSFDSSRRTLLQQASADESLMKTDPDLWRKVVRKSMKGGDDFDGGVEDGIEASIGRDEVRGGGYNASRLPNITNNHPRRRQRGGRGAIGGRKSRHSTVSSR